MNTQSYQASTQVMWLSDLHLNRAPKLQQSLLFDRLAGIEYDSVIITGDISSSHHVRNHLRQLAAAASPRPIYCVLGNHDYYDSSLCEVDTQVADLCGTIKNLHLLDGRHIIPLGHGVGLIGHRGWPDARAGYGIDTVVDSPDHGMIDDFKGLDRPDAFHKMVELGRESACVFRNILPLALTCYRHVVIATHVPPFPNVVLYDSRPCSRWHLPHFSNVSAGKTIRAITRAFPARRVTILSGHSHSPCDAAILPNLRVRVGGARTGMPDVQDVIGFS